MSHVYQQLAEHAELTIGGGGEVLIYAGQLVIHAVKFELQSSHERLAWVQDNEEQELLLDIGAIYAVREIVGSPPPSTWLPS